MCWCFCPAAAKSARFCVGWNWIRPAPGWRWFRCMAIWLARRRDKGRPAPRWERVWIAVVWSQPFAYAASIIGALSAPMIPPVAVWAVATAAALATTLVWDVKAISARLRLATAALLVAAAASHLAVHRAIYADAMAWGVQASLIAAAAVLVASVLLGRAPRAAS